MRGVRPLCSGRLLADHPEVVAAAAGEVLASDAVGLEKYHQFTKNSRNVYHSTPGVSKDLDVLSLNQIQVATSFERLYLDDHVESHAGSVSGPQGTLVHRGNLNTKSEDYHYMVGRSAIGMFKRKIVFVLSAYFA